MSTTTARNAGSSGGRWPLWISTISWACSGAASASSDPPVRTPRRRSGCAPGSWYRLRRRSEGDDHEREPSPDRGFAVLRAPDSGTGCQTARGHDLLLRAGMGRRHPLTSMSGTPCDPRPTHGRVNPGLLLKSEQAERRGQTLRGLEHDDRDLPVGAALVALVVRVRVGHHPPEPRPLLTVASRARTWRFSPSTTPSSRDSRAGCGTRPGASVPPFEAIRTRLSPSGSQSSGCVRRLPDFRPTDSTSATGTP